MAASCTVVDLDLSIDYGHHVIVTDGPPVKSNAATRADAPSQLEKYLGIDVCSFELRDREDNHQVHCVFRAIAKFG